MSSDEAATPESTEPEIVLVALEHLPDEDLAILVDLLKDGDGRNDVIMLVGLLNEALRPEDRPRTRIVFTGDLISSVNDRSGDSAREYTVDRGSGLVAAKTMPPGKDGIVEILIPTYSLSLLLPNEAGETGAHLVVHTVLHEVVHATFHHVGNEPLGVLGRRSFGTATLEFVALAAGQVDEYLAEAICMHRGAPRSETAAADLCTTISAFEDTLLKELPLLDASDPDYWARAKDVTLGAFDVLWKTLAYFAAELRTGEAFADVPEGVVETHEWQSWVEPWWERYLALLDNVPVSYEQEADSLDKTLEQMGKLLQEWAYALGFDFHDTDGGRNAWFGFVS